MCLTYIHGNSSEEARNSRSGYGTGRLGWKEPGRVFFLGNLFVFSVLLALICIYVELEIATSNNDSTMCIFVFV
ncbi:uncharacterized protein BO72DRAFT_78103 [Aspergillus fijiensis CBS 313.89]|uniref:Uncharacterized protein n=1 Tax=Aspergillus fijiensis CBS 313.89 TaxID=1448319 RepID=A0A8G1RUQ7_9EURO|nr:uncharacterized protein BO72DRAFT_78103 [Aspergillus fijiensis CBS 313.89]RAK78205.1 hypothetical protein BO72DRAFT_78103 [Aspergillus fijiensis CBS 313.89]